MGGERINTPAFSFIHSQKEMLKKSGTSASTEVLALSTSRLVDAGWPAQISIAYIFLLTNSHNVQLNRFDTRML